MHRLVHVSLFFAFSFFSILVNAQIKGPTGVELKKGLAVEVWSVKDQPTDFKKIVTTKKLLKATIERPTLSYPGYLKNYGFLPDYFWYVKISGYINIPESKTYLLKLRANQGSQLSLDEREITMNNNLGGIEEKEAEVYLEKGLRELTIRHWSGDSRQYRELTLWWFNSKLDKWEYIPQEYFYYEPFDGDVPASDVKLEFDEDMTLVESIHPSFTIQHLANKNFQPPVGGMDFLPDGRLVVSTWESTGSVYIVENVQSGDSNKVVTKRIAWGLAEPLGVKVVDGEIYVLQKQELTRLVDNNGDGYTDFYETVCNAWGATGNFHEFSFGLEYKEGFFYAALAIAINPGGKSTIPQHLDRGQCIKIAKDGSSYQFIAAGLRTPNGVGIGVDNEIFIADNQGDWLPSCKIVHVTKGAFFGNLSVDPHKYGKTPMKNPVVWLPQNEIGNSTTQMTTLNVGPYKNQMVFGDVTHGGVKRLFVEKIAGEYQGCAFELTQGLEGGSNRMVWGPDGSLYVGCIGNPGNWGQYKKKWYGLDRLTYNGKPAFELLAVRAKKNGFELEFTEPMAENNGNLIEDYTIASWRYAPNWNYGGPKMDRDDPEILSINWVPESNRTKVFVELDTNEMKKTYVYMIKVNPEIKSKEGRTIFTAKGYYTLNNIPEESGYLKPKPKTTAKKDVKTTAKATDKPKTVAAKADPAKVIAEGKALVAQNCVQCHAMDKKVLGPSWKMVAGRYPSSPENIQKLTQKVYNGGGGVWGTYVMAAQSHLDMKDIEKMVTYVLSIK